MCCWVNACSHRRSRPASCPRAAAAEGPLDSLASPTAEAEAAKLGEVEMALPFGIAAMYSVLTESVRKYEARKGTFLPEALEEFWHALDASKLEDLQKENLLHRLAELYGHGTLRLTHAARLAKLLRRLGARAVLDPFAGTGFHMRLLRAQGLHTEAADARPSGRGVYWVGVGVRSVADTSWERHGPGWALFLSWVPHWSSAGEDALRAFQGDIVVVLGDEGQWTGTEGFFRLLLADWTPVEGWPTGSPWPRLEEHVLVFARSASLAEGAGGKASAAGDPTGGQVAAAAREE